MVAGQNRILPRESNLAGGVVGIKVNFLQERFEPTPLAQWGTVPAAGAVVRFRTQPAESSSARMGRKSDISTVTVQIGDFAQFQ
jgi:hypothetical protein